MQPAKPVSHSSLRYPNIMAQIKLGQLADSLRILIKSAETFAPQHFGQMIAIEIVAHYARGGIQLWVAGTLARLAIKQTATWPKWKCAAKDNGNGGKAEAERQKASKAESRLGKVSQLLSHLINMNQWLILSSMRGKGEGGGILFGAQGRTHNFLRGAYIFLTIAFTC